MGFRENLKAARLTAKMTQQDVADRIGITKSTYCGYEIGKRQPDVEKIKLLSKILNVSGDTLIGTEFQAEVQNKCTTEMRYSLSPHEHKVITAYRAHPDMQASVDRLLQIEEDYPEEKHA